MIIEPGRTDLSTQQTGPLQEWRTHWGLVLASFIGFSFHSLTTYSAGLFMQPLSSEFGWSRAQATAGLSIAALASIPLGPVIGAIVDRWGVRIPAITGLALTACAVSLFSMASGSFTQWLALWTFYAIVATGIKSTVWTVAVTGTFTAARGLALGFVMCGAAAAQIVTPPLTRWLIDSQGWRLAYIWMGLGWGSIALLTVILLFFDARAKKQRAAKTAKAEKLIAADLPGLGFREAMGDPALICVAISTVITMFMGIALIVHQVPILTELGISRENAAWLASLSGLAGIAGKLGTGWMSDKWDAPSDWRHHAGGARTGVRHAAGASPHTIPDSAGDDHHWLFIGRKTANFRLSYQPLCRDATFRQGVWHHWWTDRGWHGTRSGDGCLDVRLLR
jgi:predicted MFS family arabinose efflux permease